MPSKSRLARDAHQQLLVASQPFWHRLSTLPPLGIEAWILERIHQLGRRRVTVPDPSLDPVTPPPSVHGMDVARTLFLQEKERAKSFSRNVAILCLVALAFHVVYGDPQRPLHFANAVAVGVLGCVAALVRIVAVRPKVESRDYVRVFGVTAMLSSFVFILYLGPFSPITAVLVLGLSFFAMGEDRRSVLVLCVVAVGAFLLLASLVTFGVLPDGGSPEHDERLPNRIFMLLLIAGVLVSSIVQARASRAATEQALTSALEAAREARARQAQLAEANQNLERVLRASTGRSGRYTGTMAAAYVLGPVVGRGAMGEVYSAIHTVTNRPAAVKLLHVDPEVEPKLARRFLREAETAARLARAPNLVEIQAVGQTPDGVSFIAMELLAGHDLGWHLRRLGRLTLHQVLTLVRDVACGLEVAHAAGVVHRDLKPQNLFLCEGGSGDLRWKILDFGVCGLRDSSGTLTEGHVVGTPNYMAPEQALCKKSDARADVFALAAVTYRALTGQVPFPGPGTPQILYQVVHEAPVRPRDLCAGIQRDVEAVLAIALAKRPENRFPDATRFSDALRAAAEGRLDSALRQHAIHLLRQQRWRAA